MTIYPSLRYRDARAAIDFLVAAFGFTEKEVYAGDDGVIHHAELAGFGGIVMLGTEPPGGDPRFGEHAGQSWLYLSTDDPDALCERAVAAGAVVIRELEDTDYGSREFSCRDPEANIWSFGTYGP
ncbi:MAG: hypothetical protein QOE31_1912 [Solirubrobacteraceae bacterium]|jgi:uncharacterized glyoxalase superfamily protein PhnB|nr:hypothetical protein [Solirubrobacteraceae bacterium]